MGTSDRIERERQAKRALIVEAARELFLERGYEAVTLRSVAERIEHSTTAVYVHFKDKRDLIEQMVGEDFAKFDAALRATAEVQPALRRLERLGEAYIDFALRLPRHYQLMFLTPRPEPMTGPPAGPTTEPSGEPMPEAMPDAEAAAKGKRRASSFDLLFSTVQACLAEGAFHPDYRDPLAIAQAVWAGVHGLVSLLIILGKEPHFQWRSPRVLHQLLLGSMLRGLQEEPPAGAGDTGAEDIGDAGEAVKRAAPKAKPPRGAGRATPRRESAGKSRRTGR